MSKMASNLREWISIIQEALDDPFNEYQYNMEGGNPPLEDIQTLQTEIENDAEYVFTERSFYDSYKEDLDTYLASYDGGSYIPGPDGRTGIPAIDLAVDIRTWLLANNANNF